MRVEGAPSFIGEAGVDTLPILSSINVLGSHHWIQFHVMETPYIGREARSAFPCEALLMPLIWVTGSSGVGKSTVCALLKSRGELALDADWEGYSHWVDRTSGRVVANPPDPVPAGWLARFGWKINRAEVETLSRRTHDKRAFLCGSVENEEVVRDLFNQIICLVADNETIRARLGARTTNAFGKHPE